MPEKLEELLNAVEEVIDNGDWPLDNADYILELVNEIRDGQSRPMEFGESV